MAKPVIVKWGGHDFYVHEKKANWSLKSGIYIFAGITRDNRWKAYYVGQAQQFSERLSSHEKWEEAVKRGATHVHAVIVSHQEDRDSIESQLVKAYQPPLNVQLKSAISPLVADALRRAMRNSIQ